MSSGWPGLICAVNSVWSCCGGKAAPAAKVWSVNRVWSLGIYPEKFMLFSPDQSFTRVSSISDASAQSEKPWWWLWLFSACSGWSGLFNSCFIPASFSWLGKWQWATQHFFFKNDISFTAINQFSASHFTLGYNIKCLISCLRGGKVLT